MRRSAIVVLAAAAAAVVPSTAASAGGHGGPTFDRFSGNPAFDCSGLPPEHCMNAKGKGKVGVIIVTNGDERWPQESFTRDARFDTRPCPHDPAGNGTWWSPDGVLYVCHHRP